MIWTPERVAAFRKFHHKPRTDEDWEDDPQYLMEQELEEEFMD